MAIRSLHLDYPASLTNQPILYQLIRRFDLQVNLRAAQISLEQGWIDIEVSGAEGEIDAALAWLRQEGIQVEERRSA